MFLTKGYKIILLSLLVSFGLFVFSNPAQAIVGTGIFDFTTAVLDALDFIDQAVLSFLVKIIIVAFLSSGFVFVAAHLLQWAVELPLYLNAPTVLGGWQFILGLVNLFFILALISIALAYILRIESIETKKTLPRLIIVILLVNFSRLIIGVFVDIAQFFMNTFMDAFGGDFITMALIPLRSSLGALQNAILVTISGYIAASFTVFGSTIALAIILGSFVAGDLLGNIFSILFLIAINILMGAIFFLYFILFLLRIAVLWLLTIFSPLAFFCLIFKQTRGLAEKWFKAVIHWAFLGAIAFFLLGLITVLFTDVFIKRPGNIEIMPVGGMPSFNLPPSIYNYLFLAIFLLVALYASVKYLPVGAEQVVGIAKKQLKKLGGPIGITKKLAGGLKGITRRIAPERTRKWGRKQAMASTFPTAEKWAGMTRRQKISSLVTANPYMRRRAGRLVTGATDRADEAVYSGARKAALDKTAQENKEAFAKTSDLPARQAILSAMIEKGQIDDNFLKTYSNEARSALSKSIKMGNKKDTKSMLISFTPQSPEFERFAQNILNKTKVYTEKNLRDDGHKNFAEYVAKLVKDKKDIELLNKKALKNDKFMKGVQEFWSNPQRKAAVEKFKDEFITRYNETTEPVEWYFETKKTVSADGKTTYKRRHSSAARQRASTNSISMGIDPIKEAATKDDIKKWEKASQRELDKLRGGKKDWGPTGASPHA